MLSVIGSIALGIFLVGLSVSQYLLNWFVFQKTGLVIIGVCGLVAGVLTLFGGFKAGQALSKRNPTV